MDHSSFGGASVGSSSNSTNPGIGVDEEDADVSMPYGQSGWCGCHSGHEHLDAIHSVACSNDIVGRSGSGNGAM